MKHFTIPRRNRLRKALIIVFWLAAWQAVYMAVGRDVIVPSPAGTLATLASMTAEPDFYINVGATMKRVIAGILISFVSGMVTAAAAYFSLLVRDLLKGVVDVLKSTPVMAVIIFALLWLASGNVPVFVCFLMCYPVVYTNILAGLGSMEEQYLEMGRVFNVRRQDVIKYIYIPYISPHIKSALSLTTGLSWKTVVAAEVLASPKFSMGYNLLNAKVYLDTESLFAWIIAIVALSMIFERLVNLLIGYKGKAAAL